MRLHILLVLVGCLLLGHQSARLASKVASLESAQVEVGRVKLTELSDAMRDRLASLHDDLTLTYYVSPPAEMPTQMRRVESSVTDLLRAMKRAGSGRVDYHIVDPTSDPDLERFAGRRKVAPVRMRSVAQDSYSEQEVWSTLTIAYGTRDPAMISALGPDHLPRLQSLLIESIGELEQPRQPVIALSAPVDGYRALRDYLATRGRVIDVNFELQPTLPRDADLLFWIAPRGVSETLLRNIHHFVASGRSLVIAGALQTASLNGGQLSLRETGYDAEPLLGSFGVRPVRGLLLDQKLAPITYPPGMEAAPFRVACLTLNQDFQSMAKEPRGTFLFDAPTPFALDVDRLASEGWRADILATSSKESAMLDAPDSTLPISSLVGAGRGVSKQPLLVSLRHVDPWVGSVVLCGAANIFHDAGFVIDTLAHKRLTDVLVTTFTMPERMIASSSNRDRPAPIPALTGKERLFWRVVVVFLLPILLIAVLLAPLARSRTGVRIPASRTAWVPGVAARIVAGMATVIALAMVFSGRGRADLTDERTNQLGTASREIASHARGTDRVDVTCYITGEDRLPPELRARVPQLFSMFDEFARQGADLRVSRVRPEDLSDAERTELASDGIVPTKSTSRQDEVTTVRNVYCAVRLRGSDRSEVLSFADVDAFENLEFRIAFGLWRLQTGLHPHVGFASDVPRLSAAENYQIYQSKGLIPPSGIDVYSLARSILERADFRVTHINPTEPVIPDDLDALVWLQPRRTVAPMLESAIDYLYRGGNLLVAAQHFVMQSRQYRGTAFKFNYWPQPQSPDVEEFYYPGFGLKMVREVLFDATHTISNLLTIVFRSARREFVEMEHSKQFLIRTVPANYDRDSLFTRNVGDQPFLVGAYFELDQELLAAHHLTATPLISTSERSWKLDWQGGWIPDGYLPGPTDPILAADAEAAGAPMKDDEGGDILRPESFLGSVPLAVLVEGEFPWPKKAFVFPPKVFGSDGTLQETEEPPDYPHPEPTEAHAPGRLVMIGGSEMFKDVRLTELRPKFRPDHLLLNSVATLALEPSLAEIITRRTVSRGFAPPPKEDRLRWRGVVLGVMPLAMFLLFLLRGIVAYVSSRI